jgi:hypothetical protein
MNADEYMEKVMKIWKRWEYKLVQPLWRFLKKLKIDIATLGNIKRK